MPFKPVIEPNIEGAFLSEHPMDIVKYGRAGNVTFMTGVTTDDGAFVSPCTVSPFFTFNQIIIYSF